MIIETILNTGLGGGIVGGLGFAFQSWINYRNKKFQRKHELDIIDRKLTQEKFMAEKRLKLTEMSGIQQLLANNAGSTQNNNTGSTQNSDIDSTQNSDTGSSQNSDTGSSQNSDTDSTQNNDTDSTQNSDTGSSQNSDTGSSQNSDTDSSQNSDTGSSQNNNTDSSQNNDTDSTQNSYNDVVNARNNDAAKYLLAIPANSPWAVVHAMMIVDFIRGLVRPGVTFIAVIVISIAQFLEIAVSPIVMNVALMAVAFYFGHKLMK